jgi:hypothetical protein
MNNKNDTPKNACRAARSHIDRLAKMLQAELDARDMREDTWPVAGSLGHVRELLGEAVGFLKGVEGHEILDAMINKRR